MNILLVGAWAFALIWFVGTSVVEGDLPVSPAFFIASSTSAMAVALPKGSARVGQ